MNALRKQSVLLGILALLVFSVNSQMHPLFHGGFSLERNFVPAAVESPHYSEDGHHAHDRSELCPFCHFNTVDSALAAAAGNHDFAQLSTLSETFECVPVITASIRSPGARAPPFLPHSQN